MDREYSDEDALKVELKTDKIFQKQFSWRIPI